MHCCRSEQRAIVHVVAGPSRAECCECWGCASAERAQAAEGIGDRAEAERLYRGLMKSDPTDAAPSFNLGNMLRADGRKVEAEAAFRAATRADPLYAEAWYNLSDLLDEQGK